MPMVPRPESDKALTDPVDPACQELISAFVTWVAAEGGSVQHYVASRLSQPAESQEVREVVQDAIYRTYAAICRGNFEDRGQGAFTAYVMTTAQRLLVNEYRHSKRYIAFAEFDEHMGGEADPISDFERRDFIRYLLEQLRPRRREVLQRHYFDEQSYAEIAAELAISEELVRQEKSRGLREARQHC